MRSRFDDNNPDIKVVVAEYRDAMRRRLRWIGPGVILVILILLVLRGTYSVEPGEVGVVRTFGKASPDLSQPGLHFRFPIAQQVDIVDIATIRRAEVGFRSTKGGPKRIDSEALMLTGDENIIEAQMIVQYQISEPNKYLFKLGDPEAVLHIAAEVALRGVVGTMRITSSIEELRESEQIAGLQEELEKLEKQTEATEPTEEEIKAAEELTPEEAAKKKAEAEREAEELKKVEDERKQEEQKQAEALLKKEKMDPSTDILTKGRERAQVATREKLQELMDLYESGLKITEVKLQVVDAPDEVKDAFHDVVRAREEREQKINKALGYREDRIPRARGEAQKVIRAAEAYKQERVLRSQGEATRFVAILREYKKAQGVTRERLHLETMERILSSVNKKVFIDKDVAKNALPFLPLTGAGAVQGAAPQGGQ